MHHVQSFKPQVSYSFDESFTSSESQSPSTETVYLSAIPSVEEESTEAENAVVNQVQLLLCENLTVALRKVKVGVGHY